jgi:protein TonB
LALVLSLLFHAAALAALDWLGADDSARFEVVPPRVPLAVVRLTPEPSPAAQPPLVLPDPASATRLHPMPRSKSDPPRREKVPAPAQPVQVLLGQAAGVAAEQIARNLLYPPEAIALGLEGEALVLLFLDESGSAIAARLERSSGHPILDQAALHAARTIRALPDGTPHEFLLPVRFRLR